jgi:DNA-binding MarR family transcriptional regulator
MTGGAPVDRQRLDEWQFWALVAIADRDLNRDRIRNRIVKLVRTSRDLRQLPSQVGPALESLYRAGLIEKLGGGGLLRSDDYRVTAAGREACRNEIDLRRRELGAIDKDDDVRRWLGR